MSEPRIAFLTGSGSWLRARALEVKRAKMRLERVVYPDVYALPLFLAGSFTYVPDGTAIEPGRFDLILSELNRSESQLAYLDAVVRSRVAPVVVIPGPPELLASVLTDAKLRLARSILANAAAVWAYSEQIRLFADGLAGVPRAVTIPWPFHAAGTRRIGGRTDGKGDRVRILVGSPLRFGGVDHNFPLLLKGALEDGLAALPAAARARVTLHAHCYRGEDRLAFDASGFAERIPVRLESKKGYRAFVRSLAQCGAVINVTAGAVLGRITFLAAALDRPGLFSDNAELNRVLYPNACVPMLDPGALRESVGALLLHATGERPDGRFAPDAAAVGRVGDFAANRDRVRALAHEAIAAWAGSDQPGARRVPQNAP